MLLLRWLTTLLLLLLSLPASAGDGLEVGSILLLRFDDVPINVGTEAWLHGALAQAREQHAAAVVIQLDTPGGALDATHTMVKEILASEVPVLVWVGPSGARAGSAGTFITLAAHVASMAPATTIGAAHPVLMAPGGGQEPEEGEQPKDNEAILLDKITNDTATFARNLAKLRGRDEAFAEDSVRRSVSIGADEALQRHVVDLMASSVEELLSQADGRAVTLGDDQPHALSLRGPVVVVQPTVQQSALLLLGDPNVLFLLMSLGMLGLFFEFNHPGFGVPGVLGLICLLLAAIGSALVPISVSAVALLVVGFALLAAEVWLSTFGVLGVAGVAAILFGGLFLVEQTPEFDLSVSPQLPIGMAIAAGLATALIGWLAWVAHQTPVAGGQEGMIGAIGEVIDPIGGGSATGWVFVHSERWRATSRTPLAAGARVRVTAIRGLQVQVDPVPPEV